MILCPAIDLKDGKAVRLLRGDMEKATVFNDDPAAQAMEFVEAGCDWLHLVDLNGAFAGEPVNAAAVEAILARTKVPAQLGGGIRDMATIERWLDKRLARVILGTVAVENPALVREAELKYPTATVAELTFDIDHWADLAPAAGTLTRFIRPRDLDPALGPSED